MTFCVFFVLAALGVATPDVPVPQAGPQRTVQTVRKTADGKVDTRQHAIDPNTIATTRITTPEGRTFETSLLPEQRVIIELRARPLRDRIAPGLATDIAKAHEQLRSDLMAIDQSLGAPTQSQITREFQTLFSGVAAVVAPGTLAEVRRLPYVAAVYPDARVHGSLAQSVPLIGATSVWSTYGVNGSGVKVAIIDTGIDYQHADLGGCFGAGCKVAGGYDFVNDDADPRDDNGHGTHVAGIVAANGAVKGVAPGATLLAYKALNAWGDGDASDVIAAIERAVLDGARIANLSLGAPGTPYDPMSQAVNNATAAGMLSVVSAGNGGWDYRSVESPGTALTALTVGSSTKSGQMSSFSARGYVVAGDELVMKPDVVAPGESIRSTVTTTGRNGNASGYAELSGTSMAAPHVAGAAALLLQWKPAMTATEIKGRLAGTALPLGANVFTEGAGRIDLVGAFGATIVASSTHVPLGVAAGSSGTSTLEKSVTIRNTTATARTVTLSEISPSLLPEGTTLQISPSSLTLQPGESAAVVLRATIDKAVTGVPPDPLNWTTRVRVVDQTHTVSLPVYFFRGSMLSVDFDGDPAALLLASSALGWVSSGEPGPSPYRTLVPSGPLDVLLVYVDGREMTFVVREQQDLTVDRSLTLRRSEAARTLTTKNVDDAQKPLPEDHSMTEVALGLRGGGSPERVLFNLKVGIGGHTVRFSPLSSRYAVAAATTSSFSSRYFISSWVGYGISADLQLPQAGVPFRALTRSALRPAGWQDAAVSVSPTIAIRDRQGASYGYSAGYASGELSPTILFQSAPRPSADFPMIASAVVGLYGRDGGTLTKILDGGALLHEGTSEVKLGRHAWFDLAGDEPLATLDGAETRWDLDVRPDYLSLYLWHWPGVGIIYGGEDAWMTQTMSAIRSVARKEPEFTLYRNGTLAGTYPISDLARGSVASPAGPHEIRATSNYPLGRIAGASHVVATFDTSLAGDSFPPQLSAFRLKHSGQQGGTSAVPGGAPHAAVTFSLVDTTATTATLEWRPHGDSNWTPLALEPRGTSYAALVPIQTAIDLRLTATDAAGNRFQEDWMPAAVTAADSGLPPTAPTFVEARRSATAAVTVTWQRALSDAGIAEYRIERMPGGHIGATSLLETSFVDTKVEAGNAYAYRVIAVDRNGNVSEPSSYDLATLVTFQDDPVTPLVTRIRAVHLNELQNAINAVRKAAGLPPQAWSRDSVIRSNHVVLLQYSLTAARDALQLRSLPFRWLDSGSKAVVRASDIQELRDAMR